MKFNKLINEIKNINEEVFIIPPTIEFLRIEELPILIGGVGMVGKAKTTYNDLTFNGLKAIKNAIKNGMDQGFAETNGVKYKILTHLGVDADSGTVLSKEKVANYLPKTSVEKTKVAANAALNFI